MNRKRRRGGERESESERVRERAHTTRKQSERGE